jgi:enamine deaminase RidA (YjgF/YER057c/UK114 family)
MTARDVVFPAGRQALYDKNRYSPAIRANGLLFVSGQVGSREDGSPKPTLEGQVRRAFDNPMRSPACGRLPPAGRS